MNNKKAKLVVAASAPIETCKLPATDWSICCLCQKNNDNSNLVWPANNPILSRRNLGYSTLSANLEKVKGFGHTLPSTRSVTSLDEGGGIHDTLKKRQAKWHKTCRDKYMPPKLDILLNALQRNEREDDCNNNNAQKAYGTRAGSVTVRMKDQLCYFCHGVATWKEPLHQCETKEIYLHVKECASVIKDTHLLAMLETGGDLVAQEAKYHKTCLSRLYNTKRRLNCKSEKEKNIVFCEGMAFADLLSFIHMKLSSSPKYVFRMAELHKQYSHRVSQLLGQTEQSADHTTRLRQKILAHCPQLSAIKSGREYILIVEGTNMLKNFDHEDQDEDALAFYRFIYKLRNCLLDTHHEFSGSFSPTCQEESIPGPLLASMSALCYGSSDFKACGATAPLLSICQLLMANLKKGMPQGEIVRLSKDKEPPLLLYTGLAAYGRNRDKSWIDEMHKRGLCVSSDRVTAVTSQICRLTVQRAREENVVCPENLRRGLHTMGAIDNVDFKSRSNTSKGEFHGTGISIFQSREAGEQGEIRTFATSYSDVAAGGERSVPELPDFYSVVPDIVLPSVKPSSPVCSEESARDMRTEGLMSNHWRQEADWLTHAHGLLSDTIDSEQNVSWAAYHASRDCRRKISSLNAMLPLFYEKSTNPAMIKHGIDVVMAVTHHVNGEQTAVVGCDLPVYVLGKAIQCNWPEKYGGKKLLLMLGPLHIEMAFLKVIGSLLDGCGWLQIVISSGIATSGSADALLKVTHVKRSREVHQVTAAVLYSLMVEAYEEQHPDHEISIDEWCGIQSQQSPTFYFWLLVLNVLVLYLTFVRSVRESKYDLYKNSLREMLPWFFLLDHQMYARWLSTHLADLNQLSSTSPELHRQFLLGKFTVSKSSECKPFSDIGLDHAHEQNNKTVKGSGGAVGLTHDPASLRRFTVGGPGVAQLLQDFNKEDDFEVDEQHADLHVHHEQTRSYQTRFADFYTNLKDSFMECQNPFTVTGPSLIVIDESRVVMDDTAVGALMKAGERGLAMYQEFVDERLVTKTKSIYDPMKKCKFSIFKCPKKCAPVSTIKQLKSEVQLFSRLFIVSTARSLDLDEFFQYENQHDPPSLSLDGSLRGGDKAKLMSILEELILPPKKQFSNKADGVVFDGAVLVHAVKPPPTMKTFEEYSDHLNTNISQICARLEAQRCDVVWDMYDALSIKSHTREQRGLGVRRQDLPTKGKLPSKWDDYLKHDQNKEELFSYLSTKLSQKARDRHFVTNNGGEILSSQQGATLLSDFEGLEEADGRLLLHSMDMVSAGLKTIVIRSSDTDVVVLAVSHFPAMRDAGLQELWVLFATGKNRRYIAAHSIAEALGDRKAVALRGFHAMTGCDTASFFCGVGKHSFYKAWTTDDETNALYCLSQPQDCQLSAETTTALVKFVCKAYGVKGEEGLCLTTARKHLFATLGRPVNKIPPSKGCFEMHLLRSAYQSGQVWGRALHAQKPECPSQWGRKLEDGQWQPIWSTQDAIWSKAQALYKCGCQTGCGTMRCNCRRNGLNCILSCRVCKGDCENKKKDHTETLPEDPEEDVDGAV